MIKLTDILKEMMLGEDRCKRIADRRYDKPSAYKSGAIVRCRQGKIWKDLKENNPSEKDSKSRVLDALKAKQTRYLPGTAEDRLIKKIIKDVTSLDGEELRNHLKNNFLNGKNSWKVRIIFADLLDAFEGKIKEAPQSGKSSGKPAQFKPGTKPEKIENLTLTQIIQQVKGIPYYKDVLDDVSKEDESWEVTKKVKEYAEYMKKNPSSLNNLPPIIVIDGKLQDGAHRISAIYLLQNLLDKDNNFWKNLKLKIEFWNSKSLETGDYTFIKENETLRTWFKRKGAPGKEGGWVDCNTCRDGKCKACGRKKGEKRSKYPSCRPTPAQCKTPGKGKKWGKTK